jgi:ferrous iron transport protein B
MLSAAGPAAHAYGRPAVTTARIALLGNPNTGKTTLFNALCGARAKTSNFPGTTTSLRTGRADLDGIRAEIVDLPGVYDLRYGSPEVRIAQDVLAGNQSDAPDVVVVIVDACNLTRNLVLVGELLAMGQRLVVALNMVDIAQRRGLTLDAARMSARLNVPVVATVATSCGARSSRRSSRRVVRFPGISPPRTPAPRRSRCGPTASSAMRFPARRTAFRATR